MANEFVELTLNTDPEQAIRAINAAMDGTTQTALKAGDVKDSINGMPLNEIFENDNKTVKRATLAEAAKSDIRFLVSGNVSDPFTETESTLPFRTMQSIMREIPGRKSLYLKRASAYIASSPYPAPIHVRCNGDEDTEWYSPEAIGDFSVSHLLYTNESSASVFVKIDIGFYLMSHTYISRGTGWLFEFAIE